MHVLFGEVDVDKGNFNRREIIVLSCEEFLLSTFVFYFYQSCAHGMSLLPPQQGIWVGVEVGMWMVEGNLFCSPPGMLVAQVRDMETYVYASVSVCMCVGVCLFVPDFWIDCIPIH